MAYQITDILQKCTKNDAEFIANILNSYINFTDDKGMKEMLSMWQSGPMPIALAQKIEKEIRYVASSDIAYGARKIRGIEPAGIEIDELINDVCTVMKIPVKKVGTIEDKLKYFAKRIVDKAFMEQSQEEQINLLKKLDISEEQIKKIVNNIKENKEKLIPALIVILGKEAAINFANTILIGIIAVFVGKKTAEQLLKVLISKMPWLAALGPIAIAGLTGWTILDICGPATRKTIPLTLYLGILSLRNNIKNEKNWE